MIDLAPDCRKCKLKTTGPWLLVESDAKLVDVAIQTDPGDTVAHCYAVWAVSTNGDVYYRDSVDTTHPTVCTVLIDGRLSQAMIDKFKLHFYICCHHSCEIS